jgi:integrase
MKTTFQVRFWEIQYKKSRKRRPHGVRWITATKEHSAWFANKALANSRRSELMTAARNGEAFDIESGLPVSEVKRLSTQSFLAFAQSYVDLKWPDAAAKTRVSMVDSLATAAVGFVRAAPGMPTDAERRRLLVSHLLPVTTRDVELSPEDAGIVSWLVEQSRPLHDLSDATATREMLDALATKMDGKTAAATVYRRKRAVLFNLLSYAVERDLLPDNPLNKVKRSAPKMDGEVDPGVVANPAQVRELLTAVTYVGQRNRERGSHLSAFFATCYYAAARPAEGLGLRETDCKLPDDGWGELALGESRPAAGKRWTDSGEVHDRRGLKHRAQNARRFVPIPPTLVRILRDHLERYGPGPDGRLFRSPNGGVVGSGTYSRVWEEARRLALPPANLASPLAGRPYDLRHAAVSLWLNGGVPPTEVAARAGHSVDVLLKVYAKCIYGQRDAVNSKIDGLYGDDDA